MGYSDVGGTGKGVTREAFDTVLQAFSRLYSRRFVSGQFSTNGEFLNALNEHLRETDIKNTNELARAIEEFDPENNEPV